MKCPKCGHPARKLRLDVYECLDKECGAIHLIHRYKAEEKRRNEKK